MWCVTVASVVAALGIDVVQQRFIANLRAAGRNDEASGLIGSATRMSMLAVVVGCVLLFGYLYWFGRGPTEGLTPTSRTMVVVVALLWFACWRLGDVYLFNLRGGNSNSVSSRASRRCRR